MKDREPFKRPPIKQHKDLLTDPQYRQRIEVHRKVRLSKLEEKDFNQELKEYLNEHDRKDSQ